MKTWGCFLLVMLAVVPGGFAQDLPTCAVMTFEATGGVSADDARVLSDRFEVEFGRLGQYALFPRANIGKVIDLQKYNLTCAGSECAMELGQLLTVQYTVFGSIGKVGSVYTVNASMVDVGTGKVEKQCSYDHRGEVEDLLQWGMASAARRLLGLAGGAPGSGDSGVGGNAGFDDLMAQIREKETEARAAEEARQAAERRLAQELARRKAEFDKQYAEYLEVVQSPHADEGMKRAAWKRITDAWGVKNAGVEPGSLTWGANGLLIVGPLAGGRVGETVTVDLGGGEKLEMVWISPGEFWMGSLENEEGRDSDEVRHRVRLTKGFWMGKTEVTQGQWQSIMRKNPSYFKNAGKNAPVEQVSWEDCQEFIRKLNAAVATDGHGLRFRLPTEAEWEYACRAGTETAIYTGSLTLRGANNGPELDPIAWYGGNSGVDYEGGYDSSGWPEKQYNHRQAGTHPVGQKAPNAWGLYDMLGNVWEWCSDWYGEYTGGEVTDPAGPRSGSCRVYRGGSWYDVARYGRSANRSWNVPGFRWYILGFRLASDSPSR